MAAIPDTFELANIGDLLASVAALGTAAFGLVDVTKAFGGGISNAGFRYIRNALAPFAPALTEAAGPAWEEVMRAHWLNGMAKDDQKALAKSLIRLGLSKDNAAGLAMSGRVDGKALQTVVSKLDSGEPLDEADLNVIGRFDSMIDARLDGGFERADQLYRNSSKALAAGFAVLLAIAGEWIVVSSRGHPLTFMEVLLACLVGTVSVPLAPIAKDLSSALVAGVKAMQASGG